MSVVGVAPAAAATYSPDDDDPTLPTGMATGFIADALFPGVDFPALFPELLPDGHDGGFLPTDATRENPDSLPDIIGLEGSNLLRDGLAAFAASAVATMLLHPLDTIKCRLQSGAYTVEPLCSEGGCVLGIPMPELPKLRRRRSARPARSSEDEEDGEADGSSLSLPGYERQRLYSNVYTGFLANVAKEAPDAAVYLALYESFSQTLLLNEWWASHWLLTVIVAGALGDACGSVLRLPAEVVAKRLQTGASPSVRDALLEQSLAEWLSAWGAILARDVPMGGLQVAFFETFRYAMQAMHAAAPDAAADVAAGAASVAAASAASFAAPDVVTDICAGALAGALAAAFTTPLDVLVTHILTTECAVLPDGTRQSALCRARLLVEEQGALTLTRGLGLRTLYYAPLVGLFFGLYEYFRAVL